MTRGVWRQGFPTATPFNGLVIRPVCCASLTYSLHSAEKSPPAARNMISEQPAGRSKLMSSSAGFVATIDEFRYQIPWRDFILRNRFIVFVVLTFAIQQIAITYRDLGLYGKYWVLKAEMLGPMFVACFMIWLQYGLERVKHTLIKLTRWRVHPIWYFHSIFWLPLAAYIAVLIRNIYLGDPIFDFPTYWAVIPNTGIPQFLGNLTLAVSEEIAWFGYAFALLYARYSAFTAALITGFFWGLSYVPIWYAEIWIAPGQPMWTVVVACMGWAFVCAWIYNETRSAFLLALLQIASNYSYSVFLVLPHLTGETLSVNLVTIALLIMGLIIVWIYGPEHLCKKEPAARGEWDSAELPKG